METEENPGILGDENGNYLPTTEFEISAQLATDGSANRETTVSSVSQVSKNVPSTTPRQLLSSEVRQALEQCHSSPPLPPPPPPPPPPQSPNPPSPVWTPQEEIILFHSLIHHKPVGFDRHLRMIFIHKRFDSRWRTREPDKRVPERVTAEMLWTKIESMYNLSALNYENQIPDEFRKEVDFELPQADFAQLMDAQMMASLEIGDDDKRDKKDRSKCDLNGGKSVGRRGRKSGPRVAPTKKITASASMPPDGNIHPKIVLSRLSCDDVKLKGNRGGGGR